MTLELEKFLLADFGVAFWCYLAGFLVYIAYLAAPRRYVSTAALSVTVAGFAIHTVAAVGRSVSLGRLPLANMYEYMVVLSWATVLGFLIMMFLVRRPTLGPIGLSVIVILMVVASLLPERRESMLVPALQSYWLKIHVSIAILGEAAFALAFATSVAYLIKSRRATPGNADESGLTPELLATITDKAIAVGYPLFTVGALFAGAIWAQKAWGTFWGWDPKEVGSLVVWLVYSAYLHARFIKGWSGQRAAWLSIAGFSLALLTFFGNMLLGGLHSYG